MAGPKVPSYLVQQIKDINSSVQLVWNDIIQRFQLIHKDRRNGVTRIIRTLEDHNSQMRLPDGDDLFYLKNVVDWGMIEAYPSAEDLKAHMIKLQKDQALKSKELRKEYLNWIQKDMKNQFAKAMENLRFGVFDKPREKKIIIT